MLCIVLASLVSFFGTLLVMPSVIKLAIKKRILAPGGGRNAHKGFTPNIGGIAIVVGLVLSNLFFVAYFLEQNILFFEDLNSPSSYKKVLNYYRGGYSFIYYWLS